MAPKQPPRGNRFSSYGNRFSSYRLGTPPGAENERFVEAKRASNINLCKRVNGKRVSVQVLWKQAVAQSKVL